MIVVITGVGGVGKTTIAKILHKRLGWRLVKPDDVAKKRRMYLGYDKDRKSWIVDLSKLKKEIKKMESKEKNLILEGLYSHFFDADLVAVLRCQPDVLEKRLRKKYDWPTKIVENKEAEMVGIIVDEAIEKHGRSNVYEFDTTGLTPTQTERQIEQVIKGNKNKIKYRAGRIDWLSKI